MVLGWRGPRSKGMQITAGVALAATFIGPLRLAYAIPVAPTEAPAKPSEAASTPPTSAPAVKLPTDVPWALATAIRPTRIEVLAGSVDEAAIWRLFDGRSTTGVEPAGTPVRFLAELPQPTYLDAVAVFGKVAGALSVETKGPKGATALLQKAALTGGAARWNRTDIANAPLATKVTVTFEPGAPDAILPELEFWGRPASAPAAVANATFPDALYAGVPAGARELKASEAEQTISPATVSAPGVG